MGAQWPFSTPTGFLQRQAEQQKMAFKDNAWTLRMHMEFWLLTQKNVGSIRVWVCPCRQWPASYASDKGQMSWHLCGWWKPSGHVVLGAVASRSVGPSWSFLRSRRLWSHSTAAECLLEAARSLRTNKGKNSILLQAMIINQNMLFGTRLSRYQNKWSIAHMYKHTRTYTDELYRVILSISIQGCEY